MVNRANEVARFLRVKRQELKLSQVGLASNLGWDSKQAQFLSNIERGICQFPIRYVKKLAETLQVSEETIIDLMAQDYKLNLIEVLNETNSSDATIV